ncbi:MAG: alpha/beta fold hydrolase [Anaerolineae bacterium]|nr:alpha/beta fold hydrolase [Anaerolineae bacterium]
MNTDNQPATLSTAGFKTYLNRTGAGNKETVLFLHGSGPGATAWSNWQYALPYFADRYDTLAPDFIGFGESEHPNPAPTSMHQWMRIWKDQVTELLDALDKDKVHLVGNSMGGAVALHLLMEAPERFDKVVLMGPIGAPMELTPELDQLWGFYADPSPAGMKQRITWFAYDINLIADRLDAIAEMRFTAAMDEGVRRSFEAMFPAPRQTLLDQLVVPDLALRHMDHPTLLVHGRDDKIVPMDTSLHLLPRLPNVQLHIFGKCSHWTQIEHKDSFNRLLREFFEGEV